MYSYEYCFHFQKSSRNLPKIADIDQFIQKINIPKNISILTKISLNFR